MLLAKPFPPTEELNIKQMKAVVTYQHTWWRWLSCRTWRGQRRGAGWSSGPGSSWVLDYVCRGREGCRRLRDSWTRPETSPRPGHAETRDGQTEFTYLCNLLVQRHKRAYCICGLCLIGMGIIRKCSVPSLMLKLIFSLYIILRHININKLFSL